MDHMKFLLVAPSIEPVSRRGTQRGMLFLVHPEEELKIQDAVRAAPRKMKVLFSQPLDGEPAYDELAALLTPDRTLGVTSQCVTTPEITKLVLRAHLRGTRIMEFEKGLLELIPSVPANMNEIVKAVVQSAMRQDGNIRLYSKFKNIAEPLIAATMLILLTPLLALIALMVKLTSPGPALYGQKRLGLGGKEFQILKFRSMRTDAEKDGPVWASAKTGDSRLSPIGGFLRATHLDELPQFWNIARGEVSFIGPRPERKLFSDQLQKDIPAFALRTLVKPGITGWAQTRQGYANSVEDSRRKLELDFYYILKHSPRLDAQVVLSTLGILVSGGTEGKKRKVTKALEMDSTVTTIPQLALPTKQRRSDSYGLNLGLPMFWRRSHLNGPRSKPSPAPGTTEMRSTRTV